MAGRIVIFAPVKQCFAKFPSSIFIRDGFPLIQQIHNYFGVMVKEKNTPRRTGIPGRSTQGSQQFRATEDGHYNQHIVHNSHNIDCVF